MRTIMTKSDLLQKMSEVLKEKKQWMNAPELAEAVGVCDMTVRRRMKDVTDEELIEHDILRHSEYYGNRTYSVYGARGIQNPDIVGAQKNGKAYYGLDAILLMMSTFLGSQASNQWCSPETISSRIKVSPITLRKYLLEASEEQLKEFHIEASSKVNSLNHHLALYYRYHDFSLDESEQQVQVEEDVKMDRTVTHNASGYSDPTAATAIHNVLYAEPIKVGYVYNNKFLVLKAFSDAVVVVPVFDPKEHPGFESEFCVTLYKEPVLMRVNSHAIRTVDPDRLDRESAKCVSADIFRQVAGLAGMSVAEKVVEKEVVVEKTVQIPVKVPVEKIVEVEKVVEVPVEIPSVFSSEVEKLRMDLMLAQQKADIYEEVFKALARGLRR